MREFKHPNMHGFNCPICKSSKDMPVVLIPIPGTEKEGICEAAQVHSECYELFCKMNDIECNIEKENAND
jgi:hypothetical protein